MISPTLPKPFVEGDKRIARLFADYQSAEIKFFQSTGIFPIMHVTTLKQEIADKYPWVATNLTKAFEAAKQLAYRRIANPRMAPLVFVRTAVEEQEAIFGKDPWSYGLTPVNRKEGDPNYYLSDGHVTLVIMPWDITDYAGTGIITCGMDHIGFRVESVEACKADIARIAGDNPRLAPEPVGTGAEGDALAQLFRRCCPIGEHHLADCDGILIDIHAD